MPINIDFIREVGPWRWAKRTAIRQFYKRVLKQDHEMLLPTGEWMLLPIADHFASEAFITGADVDWGSEALFFSMLRCKGVFLDVGAHIGYYSMYMLPRVIEVFSFEPDPRVREMLEMNIAGRGNVHVIPWAAGATPGRARFTLERDSEASHMAKEGDDPGSQITVDVVTLDTFVRKRKLVVEAIKIDVEGHDTEVIEGGLFLLAGQEPLVLTDARPDAKLFRLMRKVGYRVFAFVRQPITRKKRFVELVADVPVPGVTKMLFLVPGRLVEEFVRLVT
jgi:FkbM family methyltransferase